MRFGKPESGVPRLRLFAKSIVFATLLMVSGLPAQALLVADCNEDCYWTAKDVYLELPAAGHSEKNATFNADIAYKGCLRKC